MILEVIRKFGRPVTINEILGVVDMDKKELIQIIEEYINEYKLMRLEDKRVVLPKQLGLCIGKIQCHPKGFAFLLQEDEDVFIPANDVGNALNGDIVAVRMYTGVRRGHSKEGRVLEVLQRATTHLVGIVTKKRGRFMLQSDDKRILQDIIIDNLNGAKIDDVVLTKVYKYPTKKKPMLVNVTKVIGNKDDSRIDIECAIASYDIPSKFKKTTLKEAKAIEQEVTSIDGRVDFRNEMTITIDGEDARDFDDAVALVYDGKNYLLKVHIADVSHYVTPGSSLDSEAYVRGNSVYFPGRVIPMLPRELSNGICSLNEGVDRYALSCVMTINDSGKVIDYEIVKSVINSNHRMTYTEANLILDGDKETREKYADVVEMIENMNELKKILFNSRLKMGSLEFDIPEAKFVLDEEGKVLDVKLHERGNSEQLIEEFMLIANMTVCKHMINMDLPCVYRVHEKPSQEKVDAFLEFALSYGLKIGKVTPKNMQKVLNEVKGEDYEKAVSVIMLRTLQKARYSHINHHHFGLAFDDYCHFTSPIRRYADLIIHRTLTAQINNSSYRLRDIEDVCAHISETEKIAMEAEMKVNDIYKCHYLQNFIGEEFDGVISGMNSAGFYVMLDNTCEGMVRFSEIRGDYYVFNEKLFQCVGERKKKVFRMGDKVRVKLTNVNLELVQVDMALISE